MLAVLAVAAFVAGVAVVVAVHQLSSRNALSAVPTATARPTSLPTNPPRPTATASTPQPAATATVAPTTAPTTPANAPAADRALIRAHGYVPDGGSMAGTPDGSGGTLYAWIATCAGSADGHCQRVFFFDGTRYLGTDTRYDSSEILHAAGAGNAAIKVTYANYLPGDPLCCPSGKPVTITYRWNGQHLVPSGTPPNAQT